MADPQVLEVYRDTIEVVHEEGDQWPDYWRCRSCGREGVRHRHGAAHSRRGGITHYGWHTTWRARGHSGPPSDRR